MTSSLYRGYGGYQIGQEIALGRNYMAWNRNLREAHSLSFLYLGNRLSWNEIWERDGKYFGLLYIHRQGAIKKNEPRRSPHLGSTPNTSELRFQLPQM